MKRIILSSYIQYYCGSLRLSQVGLVILVVQIGLLHHFRGDQRGLASEGREGAVKWDTDTLIGYAQVHVHWVLTAEDCLLARTLAASVRKRREVDKFSHWFCCTGMQHAVETCVHAELHAHIQGTRTKDHCVPTKTELWCIKRTPPIHVKDTTIMSTVK